ncbi:hypothetical protein Leryth_009868, partial [Lithospermum erythrorhizon]
MFRFQSNSHGGTRVLENTIIVTEIRASMVNEVNESALVVGDKVCRCGDCGGWGC